MSPGTKTPAPTEEKLGQPPVPAPVSTTEKVTKFRRFVSMNDAGLCEKVPPYTFLFRERGPIKGLNFETFRTDPRLTEHAYLSEQEEWQLRPNPVPGATIDVGRLQPDRIYVFRDLGVDCSEQAIAELAELFFDHYTTWEE